MIEAIARTEDEPSSQWDETVVRQACALLPCRNNVDECIELMLKRDVRCSLVEGVIQVVSKSRALKRLLAEEEQEEEEYCVHLEAQGARTCARVRRRATRRKLRRVSTNVMTSAAM